MNSSIEKNVALPPIHNSILSTYNYERKKEFLFSYSKLKKLFREDKQNTFKNIKIKNPPLKTDPKLSTMARMYSHLVIFKLIKKLKKQILRTVRIHRKN